MAQKEFSEKKIWTLDILTTHPKNGACGKASSEGWWDASGEIKGVRNTEFPAGAAQPSVFIEIDWSNEFSTKTLSRFSLGLKFENWF